MADLNNILNDVRSKSLEVNDVIAGLLNKYDGLYDESTRVFNTERIASNGNMDGLEEFYTLTQVIRRNRDIIAAVARGLKGLRPMNQFKFVEEDINIAKKATKSKKSKFSINKKNIENVQIPDEVNLNG